MIWLTWRQLRTQAAVVYAALVVVALVAAFTGPGVASLYHSVGNELLNRMSTADQDIFYVTFAVLMFAPAIIGMFWGAPLISRELEAGTHRLVWNQTVTRGRWLATKLGLTGLAAMGAAGLLSLAATWWALPIDKVVNSGGGSGGPLGEPRIGPVLFDARGVAPIGYAAFAFALGVTVGLLIRRTLPAIATTLAGYLAVQIAVPLWIRPHLAASLHAVLPISAKSLMGFNGGSIMMNIDKPGAWLVSEQTIDASGHAVALPSSFITCMNDTAPNESQRCMTGLAPYHYRQLATYQPAGHFWSLQWAETGLFIALALALTGFSAWWIRRRLS